LAPSLAACQHYYFQAAHEHDYMTIRHLAATYNLGECAAIDSLPVCRRAKKVTEERRDLRDEKILLEMQMIRWSSGTRAMLTNKYVHVTKR
jgi:hypothetical protein